MMKREFQCAGTYGKFPMALPDPLRIPTPKRLESLLQEANEIKAILITMSTKARRRL